MKKPSVTQAGIGIVLVAAIAGAAYWSSQRVPSKDAKEKTGDASKQRATLAVTTIKAQLADWPLQLSANGNVSAWQEAIVGSELGGLRLTEVLVNVGDVVVRGQELARFASDSVAADLAQQEAALEEARAALAEAGANAERARTLQARGMMSAQQSTQLLTAERSAKARLQSAQARLQIEQIRLRQTKLLAPDDGVISARTATVGAVTPAGLELFKLIRKGRLEWRAEVTSSELMRIKPGQPVSVLGANGARVDGSVRMIAPTVDPVTRNAMVYVDLPNAGALHAGMFATGHFELGHASALSVPQSAVVPRDGYNYVFQVGADKKVAQTRVTVGRRVGERIELLSGATPDMTLVGQGAGFLADGDLVAVVAPPAGPAAPAK